MKKKIVANDLHHLEALIKKEIKLNGYQCDLNHIDVSQIKELAFLFSSSKFNGNISEWDVSNATNMLNMFKNSEFNGDISKWNVSNVKYMCSMFENSEFNGNISNWNVRDVEDMNNMFVDSEFQQDLSCWDVSNVKNTHRMFVNSKCPIPYWKNYDDKEDRQKAINAYQLKQELEKNGNIKQDKKVKI